MSGLLGGPAQEVRSTRSLWGPGDGPIREAGGWCQDGQGSPKSLLVTHWDGLGWGPPGGEPIGDFGREWRAAPFTPWHLLYPQSTSLEGETGPRLALGGG